MTPEPRRFRSIALVGCRGAGKTSVGRELARLLDFAFFDTDAMIVARTRRSIADVFAAGGEEAFRRLESEVIADVVQRVPAVISVGGGAVLRPENIQALRSQCRVIWLTAPLDVLFRRVSADPASGDARPPLTSHPPREELAALLAGRAPLYESAADLAVDTTAGCPATLAIQISRRLAETPTAPG